MRFLVLAAGLLAGCFYERRSWDDEPLGASARRNPVSVDEVLRLTQAGVGEDVIVSWIRTEGAALRPTSDEIVRMKNACVGDRVIEALLTAPLSRPDPEIRYRVEPWYSWEPYPWGWIWPYWHFEYRYPRHHR